MICCLLLLTVVVFRLQLFQRFEKFRVMVLGGDGSIGWVLSTIDKYNLNSKVGKADHWRCGHLACDMCTSL